jgi:predicted transcriptional regulator
MNHHKSMSYHEDEQNPKNNEHSYRMSSGRGKYLYSKIQKSKKKKNLPMNILKYLPFMKKNIKQWINGKV